MIIGKIFGKITTNDFKFYLEGEAKKLDYIQIYHANYEFVLCQIVEIEKFNDKTIAKCSIIGYLDENNLVKPIRVPFEPGSEVLIAKDDFIREIIQIKNTENTGYIGKLEGKDIKINVDLNKLLTKHIAILAKSGAGKSYCTGVLIEEIIDKNIPLLIIDTHGEYSDLKYPAQKDLERLKLFGLKPQSYIGKIQEYADRTINENAFDLRIPAELTNEEIAHILPAKLSANQQNILYSALRNTHKTNLHELMHTIEMEESNAKYSVINIIEQIIKYGIFSMNPINYNELIKPGQASIINMKGIEPVVQEIIVYKLIKDLFELRKKEQIPPFFTIIEEAHNYCPERAFGETKASKILRTIASEGRKFGQGLCVVSQRPARVDKSILSQCSTQIILKVTNPNDLKALTASVEGINSASEKEIANLPIGSALVTGVVDVPLFVNIRPRKSKHGGESVDLLQKDDSDEINFFEKIESFEEKKVLPLIKPKISIKEIQIMEGKEIEEVKKYLIPAYLMECETQTECFQILYDRYNKGIIKDEKLKLIPDLKELNNFELNILRQIFEKKEIGINDIVNLDVNGQIAIKNLVNKQLITVNSNIYKLNENYIFTKLDNFKSFRKIEYSSTNYTEKLEPKIEKEEIEEIFRPFLKIKTFTNCYMVKQFINFKK
jgi:uncharacterized protein